MPLRFAKIETETVGFRTYGFRTYVRRGVRKLKFLCCHNDDIQTGCRRLGSHGTLHAHGGLGALRSGLLLPPASFFIGWALGLAVKSRPLHPPERTAEVANSPTNQGKWSLHWHFGPAGPMCVPIYRLMGRRPKFLEALPLPPAIHGCHVRGAGSMW